MNPSMKYSVDFLSTYLTGAPYDSLAREICQKSQALKMILNMYIDSHHYMLLSIKNCTSVLIKNRTTFS